MTPSIGLNMAGISGKARGFEAILNFIITMRKILKMNNKQTNNLDTILEFEDNYLGS